MKWITNLLLPALLGCISVHAQSQSDTSFIAAAKLYVTNLHEKALGAQARLYNGSRYVEPPFDDEHHPFLSSDDWIIGSVFYDGEYFRNVPLLYDIMSDALVTEHRPSGQPILLIPEKLSGFSMQARQFERIENQSVKNSLPATGFYEILYDGRTRVIARRQKFRRDEIEHSQVLVRYDERNRYFVLMNGVYFPVKSKASVVKVMGDRKQEINRFVRQEQLDFTNNRERALSRVAEYYDSMQ